MTKLSFLTDAPGGQAPGRVVLLGTTRILVKADTGTELAMPPVDPRRERMDDGNSATGFPEFQTDDARDGLWQVPVKNAKAKLFRRALVDPH